MVGIAGFEPTTTCPPDKCATRLRYTPLNWRARFFSILGLLSEGSPCMRTHKNGASGNGMFVTTIVGITRRHKLKSEKLHY